MIPDAADDAIRAKLLPPTIIVPPLLWLASTASDGVTGARFDASLWRGDLDEASAAKLCAQPL